MQKAREAQAKEDKAMFDEFASYVSKKYDVVGDAIDKSRDKIADLNKEISKSKQDLNDLFSSTQWDLASRVVTIRSELSGWGATAEEQMKLNKELKTAEAALRDQNIKKLTAESEALKDQNITKTKRLELEREIYNQANMLARAEIDKATTVNNETETDRIIREAEEKRVLMEQELADLERKKVEETAILDRAIASQQNIEKAYTQFFKSEIQSREDAQIASFKRIAAARNRYLWTAGTSNAVTPAWSSTNKTVNASIVVNAQWTDASQIADELLNRIDWNNL